MRDEENRAKAFDVLELLDDEEIERRQQYASEYRLRTCDPGEASIFPDPGESDGVIGDDYDLPSGAIVICTCVVCGYGLSDQAAFDDGIRWKAAADD